MRRNSTIAMAGILQSSLSSRNGFVRKGARALLQVPKRIRSLRIATNELANSPPVLANSFPKSGTHLLAQIVAGLPDRNNYGEFLGSETSSFQLRERTAENTCRFIRGFVPGEIVRGHLYYDSLYDAQLASRHAVNYFIYRDPRDVVISEAHYLREMNRWHRLHPYFRQAASIEEAIMLSINGLDPAVPGIFYPNIAKRWARYHGWLNTNRCLSVRFEDLTSERQPETIRAIVEFYATHTAKPCDIAATTAHMLKLVAPQKSHTFRNGKQATWQREFTADHRARFLEVAGDLLLELGYELNYEWALRSIPSRTDSYAAPARPCLNSALTAAAAAGIA